MSIWLVSLYKISWGPGSLRTRPCVSQGPYLPWVLVLIYQLIYYCNSFLLGLLPSLWLPGYSPFSNTLIFSITTILPLHSPSSSSLELTISKSHGFMTPFVSPCPLVKLADSFLTFNGHSDIIFTLIPSTTMHVCCVCQTLCLMQDKSACLVLCLRIYKNYLNSFSWQLCEITKVHTPTFKYCWAPDNSEFRVFADFRTATECAYYIWHGNFPGQHLIIKGIEISVA